MQQHTYSSRTHSHSPGFTTSSTLPVRPTPRQLAVGSPLEPTLVVVPDYTSTTGEPEGRYASLAAATGSKHDIYELPHSTILVLDSLDALVEVHAGTVREVFAKKPVILVGFSAGGCVGHAVAHQLLSQAADWDRVAGLVLIDTYAILPEDTQAWLMRLALPATTEPVHGDSRLE